MKSSMAYHGASTPLTRSVTAAVFANSSFGNEREWTETVKYIWNNATHREERYAAVALARHEAAGEWRYQVQALDLYAFLIQAGSWWDYVDDLASHHVGDVLRAHPVETKQILRVWSAGSHTWLRRTAIIAQLGSKGADMDLPFLFDMIRPAWSEDEFFLRKAIGWSLRQAAREFPVEVITFVDDNSASLSALSIRESLKHFGLTVAAAKRIIASKRTAAAAGVVQTAVPDDKESKDAQPESNTPKHPRETTTPTPAKGKAPKRGRKRKADIKTDAQPHDENGDQPQPQAVVTRSTRSKRSKQEKSKE